MKLVYLLLLVILGLAVVVDCKTYKIPNALIVGGLASGCVIKGAHIVMSADLWIFVKMFIGLFTVLLMLMPLYVLRAIGAGDAKLMLVVYVFTSFRGAVFIGLISLFIGAGIGLVKILILIIDNFIRRKKTEPLLIIHRFHFSIAIFGATIVYLLTQYGG